MTRTPNPIEAIIDAVSPYEATGEARAALERWRRAEPDLARIGSFDQLRAELGAAAGSNEARPVLDAMLRVCDGGDNLACLVVLQAFVPALYRGAIVGRFWTGDSLEECAERALSSFLFVLWSREDAAVPGAVLVARGRCEADHTVELRRREAPSAVARFPRLRGLWEESEAALAVLADVVVVLAREWVRHRRANARACNRWEVLEGLLCRGGIAFIPAERPLLEGERTWPLSAVPAGPGSFESSGRWLDHLAGFADRRRGS